MGMSHSAVVPLSGRSRRTTRIILVPTKHSFQDGGGNVDCCRSRSPSPLRFDPVHLQGSIIDGRCGIAGIAPHQAAGPAPASEIRRTARATGGFHALAI